MCVCVCVCFIWGLWCQKQVSQAEVSNCIPHYSAGFNYLSLPKIPASGTKALISTGWPGSIPYTRDEFAAPLTCVSTLVQSLVSCLTSALVQSLNSSCPKLAREQGWKAIFKGKNWMHIYKYIYAIDILTVHLLFSYIWLRRISFFNHRSDTILRPPHWPSVLEIQVCLNAM